MTILTISTIYICIYSIIHLYSVMYTNLIDMKITMTIIGGHNPETLARAAELCVEYGGNYKVL